MTRKTYRKCKFCGDFHDVDNWPDNHREYVPDNRSELPAPAVVTDEMRPIQGMHNGEVFTSKRALRQSYRDHGVVEVGNDASITSPKPQTETRAQKQERREKIKSAVRSAVSKVNLTTPTKDIPRNYRL